MGELTKANTRIIDAGRSATILTVHARGKNLEPDVDLGQVAAATPGFAGADLANLVNEAALFGRESLRTRAMTGWALLTAC